VRVLHSNSARGSVQLLLGPDEVRTGDFAPGIDFVKHAAREIGIAKVRTADGTVHKGTTVSWVELLGPDSVRALSKCTGDSCAVIADGDTMVGLVVKDRELLKEIVAGRVAVELTSQGVVLSAGATPTAKSRGGTEPGDLITHAVMAGLRAQRR
jgi:hypothetical protein